MAAGISRMHLGSSRQPLEQEQRHVVPNDDLSCRHQLQPGRCVAAQALREKLPALRQCD